MGSCSLKVGPKNQFRTVPNRFFGAAGEGLRSSVGERSSRGSARGNSRLLRREGAASKRARWCLMATSPTYLDHNASAPLLPEARDAIVAALALTGNPSSVHGHGRALRALIDGARTAVAKLAGATREQVVFTGSATEAITQAIVGGAKALGVGGIVVSAGDHTAALKAAEATGLPVTTVGLDRDGQIEVDEIAAAMQ